MIITLLKHGHLPRELNKKNITLTQKRNPKKVNDYTPIILCNVSNKFNQNY